MQTLGSPLAIQLLLHCYISPAPVPGWANKTQAELLRQFQEAGLITARPENEPGSYETTPFGTAWVKALCSMPAPQMVWKASDGTIISDI